MIRTFIQEFVSNYYLCQISTVCPQVSSRWCCQLPSCETRQDVCSNPSKWVIPCWPLELLPHPITATLPRPSPPTRSPLSFAPRLLMSLPLPGTSCTGCHESKWLLCSLSDSFLFVHFGFRYLLLSRNKQSFQTGFTNLNPTLTHLICKF